MLSEGTIEFLRSRPIGMLCTRDSQNRPAEHECYLADITAGRVIALVPEHLARNLKENVADNGDAALVVSRQPGDHRSVQVKGRITDLGEARQRHDEFPMMAREGFVQWLSAVMSDAEAPAAFDRMSRQSMFRVQLDVRQEFNQTPGPNAGRAISGSDP